MRSQLEKFVKFQVNNKMIKYLKSDTFVLSSSCKVVKGAKRSVLVDYQRTDVRIISNDYANLIERLDRQAVLLVKKSIDTNSQEEFDKFLNFLVSNEFGFITNNVDLYPKISDEIFDNHITLLDGIIEIHKDRYNHSDFKEIIRKFDDLLCGNIQIRILSKISSKLLNEVLNIIKNTNISYLEIHMSENGRNKEYYHNLINNNAKLTEVFLYGSTKNEAIEVVNKKAGHYQLTLGSIHFKTSRLSDSICGVINFKDLSFGELSMHNLLKNHNGCLYKKLTIDSYGNIKNCPSIKTHFGHHSKIDIRNILTDKKFKSLGSIKKDEIEICKDCEFRYNCTDCRAFTEDPENLYSKPLKCGYSPYTNKWEDWSKNPLKSTAIEYYES